MFSLKTVKGQCVILCKLSHLKCIAKQGSSRLYSGQKLKTVWCSRSCAFVEWEGALEITASSNPGSKEQQGRAQHCVAIHLAGGKEQVAKGLA